MEREILNLRETVEQGNRQTSKKKDRKKKENKKERNTHTYKHIHPSKQHKESEEKKK